MKAPQSTGLAAAVALTLLSKAAIAGDAIDLFVDTRPGNPCQQFTDLRDAIVQAGLEAADAQKTIHLIRGASFTGRSYRINDLQNLKITADVLDVEDSCEIALPTLPPNPAKFNGAGLTNGRTLEISANAATGVPGSVEIENVEFLNNINSGALSVMNSAVLLRNVTFRDNTARVDSEREGGGAIAVVENGLQTFLRLLGSVKFVNNRAVVQEGIDVEALGGAVFCEGGAVISAPPFANGEAATFGDGTEAGANVAEGYGGAIAALNCGIDLDDTAFRANSASIAGGAVALEETRNSRVFLTNTEFVGNRQTSDGAEGGLGAGALLVISASTSDAVQSTVQIESSRFVLNEAAGAIGGGAVVVHANDDQFPTAVTVENTYFGDNGASAQGSMGGAVLVGSNPAAPALLMVSCTDTSQTLSADRHCAEFRSNWADANAAAIGILGSYANGSSLRNVALIDNALVAPDEKARPGSALSIASDESSGDFVLAQVLVDSQANSADAAISFDTTARGTASLLVQRSTIRYNGRVIDADVPTVWENSLVVGGDVGDLPPPGADFVCSFATEDADFPGLDLVATARGGLRPGANSILRQHSGALFQPCDDDQRVTALPDFDLEGNLRPSEDDVTFDAPDIGAFEYTDAPVDPDDAIFSNGFEGGPGPVLP